MKSGSIMSLSTSFIFYSTQDGPVFLDGSHLPDVVFSCYMIYYPLVTLNLLLNCFADAPPMLKRKAIPKDEVIMEQ